MVLQLLLSNDNNRHYLVINRETCLLQGQRKWTSATFSEPKLVSY